MHQVGLQRLTLVDEQLRNGAHAALAESPLLVLYPGAAEGGGQDSAHQFGPYVIAAAENARPIARRAPVVVISHGSGGSGLVYRDMAVFLAQHGCVVLLPEHAGNNRRDNSLDGTSLNLELRPRHLSLAIDALASHAVLGPAAATDSVAVVGHSMGGYTALAVAGGQPWTDPAHGPSEPVAVTRDNRVQRLVLLAPATPWFTPANALVEVNLPILLLEAEHDPLTPPSMAQRVVDGVADAKQVDHQIIKGAGHFAFLTPFPRTMVSPQFAPSQDPPGFNREAFHNTLYPHLLSFVTYKTL